MNTDQETSEGTADDGQDQEKVKATAWTSLDEPDLEFAAAGFIHLNPKTVNSTIGDLGFRLPYGRSRRELPYIALSVLGADHRDLDFTDGGAGAIRKPRQIKDGIVGQPAGLPWASSGMLWTNVPSEDVALLAEGQVLEQRLRLPLQKIPAKVPPLLRQVIVPDAKGEDLVLSPMGGLGLNRQILERLEQESQKRNPEGGFSRFWRVAVNNLGGSKPQNLGLLGTVQGGKRLASFAWLFPAPGFPSLRIRQAVAVLFRDFNVHLTTKQAKDLRKALENHEKEPTFDTERALVSQVQKLAKALQVSSLVWRQELERQLWSDIQSDRRRHPQAHPEVKTPAQAWAAAWEEGHLPESNSAAWEYALGKDDYQLSWFFHDRRTHTWAKTAAERIAGQWLGQLRLPVSGATRSTIEKAIAREVMP